MSTYVVLKGNSVKDDCTTQMCNYIKLCVYDWEVGVISIVLDVKDSTMLWLFGDVVDYSVVNNLSLQLLDIVPAGVKNNTKPRYVKVIKKTFSSINVDIQKEISKDELITGVKEIIIVLHFRKT